MNINIKITHPSGTVMEVSIPILDSTAITVPSAPVTPEEPQAASEPAISLEEEPQGMVQPDEIVPEGKPAELIEEPPQDIGDQFPCQDGFYSLPPNLYSDFCSAFGQTMVDRELTLACLWIKSNPTKRKTRRGMSRYLNAWLCRAQGEKRQSLKSRSGSLLDSTNTSQQGW
jgi:hypothetical protein